MVDCLDCAHILPSITQVYLVNFQSSIIGDVESFSSNLGDPSIVHTRNPVPCSVFVVTFFGCAK